MPALHMSLHSIAYALLRTRPFYTHSATRVATFVVSHLKIDRVKGVGKAPIAIVEVEFQKHHA